jgi:hypothetical protein
MIIDEETHKLSEYNFIKQGTKKTRIIIGNTFTSDMKHCIGWVNRWNGNYTKTAMFTIDIKGNVFQHFSPIYFSKLLDNEELNEGSITILLENEGWLTKDLSDENKYINYIGDIYNRKDSVFEKRWRNHMYWAPYSDKQSESLYDLIKELCNEFDIPLKVIPHNTNFDGAYDYKGILYKSNFYKYYTDTSPAWDCVSFKNKIELN